MRHIHLQPLGGAAGDMFVACLLNAFPEHEAAVVAAAAEVSGVPCRLEPHRDAVFAGSRFVVERGTPPRQRHRHTHWADLRSRLEDSALPRAVCQHAVGIFGILAEAEARVHGVQPDDVAFHEVGAVDSLADIVAASAIIAAVGPAHWTVGTLPLGGGTVETAHGTMPVPTPATALLLEGFTLQDDGVAGERVTPTGAAILRYLGCSNGPQAAGSLDRSGAGFGTHILQGRSNCLRALVFQNDEVVSPSHRELGVITFEIDDQSPEELALGLERLRAEPGVHDVVQMACSSKKCRHAVHVQVLTAPEQLDQITAVCFRETTTIGVRTQLVEGRALPRQHVSVDVAGRVVPVKLVARPGIEGTIVMTAKAEADHVQMIGSHAARARLRHEAEQVALARVGSVPSGEGTVT